jgi:hypothetical protein
MRRILLASAACLLCHGAFADMMGPSPVFINRSVVPPAAPVSTWTLVNHVATPSGSGASPLVSAAVNMTGVKLFVVCVEYYVGASTPPTLSDSQSNTWSIRTQYNGANSSIAFYYLISPSVSSTQTITLTTGGGATNFFGQGQIMGFTEAGTPTIDSPLTSATGTTTTIQPGSRTPAQINSLIVTCNGDGYTGTTSVTSPAGFTTVDGTPNGGSNVGGWNAWAQQTTAVAVNPTWTATGSASAADNNASMAVFAP